VAIAIGQRVVCPPYGIGTVARTVGALVDNKPTPCFVVRIEVAGLVIERRGESQFSLGEIVPGFEAVLPMDVAPSRLRPLADAAAARDALDRLQPADAAAYSNATFAERLHRIDHAMRSGSLDACADLLCETLRLLTGAAGAATSFGERKALHALERLVIGEIALSLEEPADKLLEQVRAR
jgi:RNA polymerase-interacting CarD/CdnL/TRCF family regulator